MERLVISPPREVSDRRNIDTLSLVSIVLAMGSLHIDSATLSKVVLASVRDEVMM